MPRLERFWRPLVIAVNESGLTDGQFDAKDVANTSDDMAAGRAAKRSVVADVPEDEVRELSDDEIIARINSGEFKVPAQKRTAPIEESCS